MATRVMIVEDDAAYLRRLRDAVSTDDTFEVVATAATAAQSLSLMVAARPDLLLVDLGLPDGSGLQVIREANRRLTACEVLVVTIFGNLENVVAALEAGATGYLLKDDRTLDVTGGLQEILRGGSPLSPIIARTLLSRLCPPSTPLREGPDARLSPRELEVLKLLARGYNYREIGEHLGVAENTVGSFIKRIYRKLHVTSRQEAVFEARTMGLLAS